MFLEQQRSRRALPQAAPEPGAMGHFNIVMHQDAVMPHAEAGIGRLDPAGIETRRREDYA